MIEEYWLRVRREDAEFSVTEFVSPEDRFGKKVLSILLAQISSELERQVEASEGE